jgi:Helix-turn-helix domain
MATITPLKTTSHTRIENNIIDEYLPQIGVYGFTIYTVIKRHLNQKTSQCNPSYGTIARKIGIDRSTVIRYVNKLKALNLISPLLRFKEDGSPTSNQYNFQTTEISVPSKNQGTQICVPSKETDKPDQTVQDSGTEPPPVVAQDNPPSGPQPPEQSSSLNKKERTTSDVASPTEKQQTCPHPPESIVFLTDNITICHHCYGLLDENLALVSSLPSNREEDKPAQAVYAA